MWIKKFMRNANYRSFLGDLKKISIENNRSYLLLLCDYTIVLLKRGFVFNDYLNYQLYNKTRKERKEYVSVKDQDKFYELVSPSKYKDSFSIKSNFMRIFKDYTKRDFIYKENKYNEFLSFIESHKEIIVKPIDGLGGASVSKVKTKNIKNPKLFFNEMKKSNYLLEELIIQHKDMAKYAPNSVNTLRIMTSNINNNPKILFASARFGNGKSTVDNFHQGGMAVLLNINTGEVISDAIDKKLNKYTAHPYSGIKFKGSKIPYYDKCQKMVLEAAKVIPEIGVVGWDVAITPNGPVIVEGNRRAGFDIVQVLSERGRKDIIRQVMDEKKNS